MSLRIMFIDDSDSDKVLFKYVLKAIDSSLEYITAADGKEALEYLDKAETLPDYIFLDINMPRMNGIEFLAVMKKIERLKSIPVIMYSTAQAWVYEQMAIELGAAQCLTKSSDFEGTCKVISDIILHNNVIGHGQLKNGNHEKND
jgi:CheY-like chemotaxis protein